MFILNNIKNVIFFLTKILDFIFTLIIAIYCANIYGIEMYGFLAFYVTIANLVSALSDLGFNSLVPIRHSEDPNAISKKILVGSLFVKLFLSSLFSGVVFYILHIETHVIFGVLFYFSYSMQSLWIVQQLDRMPFYCVTNVILKSGFLILIYLVSVDFDFFISLFAILYFSLFCVQLACFDFKRLQLLSKQDLLEVLRQSWPFFKLKCFTMIQIPIMNVVFYHFGLMALIGALSVVFRILGGFGFVYSLFIQIIAKSNWLFNKKTQLYNLAALYKFGFITLLYSTVSGSLSYLCLHLNTTFQWVDMGNIKNLAFLGFLTIPFYLNEATALLLGFLGKINKIQFIIGFGTLGTSVLALAEAFRLHIFVYGYFVLNFAICILVLSVTFRIFKTGRPWKSKCLV